MDGFTQVKNRCRSKGSGTPNEKKEQVTKMQRSRNSFEVLERETKEGDITKEKYVAEKHEGLIKALEEEDVQHMDMIEEEEGDDMELGELYLDAIEEDCGKKG